MKTPSPKEDDAAKKAQDDYLEEALEETFPASDPISPGHVKDEKSPRKDDRSV